jgi:hypothetical protein
MDFLEVGWGAWTALIWHKIGTGGGLLWIRWWTFCFHNMRGIFWIAQDVSVSQEGLCSMELVAKAAAFKSGIACRPVDGYWSYGGTVACILYTQKTGSMLL